MIELYKEQEEMAILTDAKDERAFLEQMSELVGSMISDGYFMTFNDGSKVPKEFMNESGVDNDKIYMNRYMNEWEIQLKEWFPQIVDICCKYRGYKSNVKEKRLLIAGTPSLNGTKPVARLE